MFDLKLLLGFVMNEITDYIGRCIVCGGQGIFDAYYCKECV